MLVEKIWNEPTLGFTREEREEREGIRLAITRNASH